MAFACDKAGKGRSTGCLRYGDSTVPVQIKRMGDGSQAGGKVLKKACGERWKYIYSAPDNREYLIDRRQNSQETRDRAGAPFCDEALTQMRAQLLGTLKNAGETAAIDGDRWKAYPKLETPANPDSGLLIQDHPWAATKIPGYTE